MYRLMMKERASRRCRKTVMPPTLRYRSNSSSNSRAKKRPGARMRMRAWLEDLLDHKVCRGLSWVDKAENIFSVVWRHASSHGFEESEHGDVFYRWAKHTGKHKSNQGSHSSYKSNFRCALHSLKDCIELTKSGDKKGEKAKRTFQFIDPSHPLFKKKKAEKKVKAELDNKSKLPDFLGEATSSSSSSSVSSSSFGAPQQPTSVQALFSGKDIQLPCSSSNCVTSCDSTSMTASQSLHSRKASSKTETTVPKLEMLLDNDTSGHSQVFMQTETNAEGITTIILQKASGAGFQNSLHKNLICNVPLECKTVDQPLSHSEDKASYKLHSSHLHAKLNCGGCVKVMNAVSEVLPLSVPIPWTCQSNQNTFLDLEIASNMEILDTQDDDHDFLSQETSNDQYNYQDIDESSRSAVYSATLLLNEPEEHVIIEQMYPDNGDNTENIFFQENPNDL